MLNSFVNQSYEGRRKAHILYLHTYTAPDFGTLLRCTTSNGRFNRRDATTFRDPDDRPTKTIPNSCAWSRCCRLPCPVVACLRRTAPAAAMMSLLLRSEGARCSRRKAIWRTGYVRREVNRFSTLREPLGAVGTRYTYKPVFMIGMELMY